MPPKVFTDTQGVVRRHCSHDPNCVHPDAPFPPIGAFHKNRSTSDGLNFWCGACMAKAAADRKKTNTAGQSSVPTRACTLGPNCINPLQPNIPATLDYFYADRKREDGLHSYCKLCFKALYKGTHPKKKVIPPPAVPDEMWPGSLIEGSAQGTSPTLPEADVREKNEYWWRAATVSKFVGLSPVTVIQMAGDEGRRFGSLTLMNRATFLRIYNTEKAEALRRRERDAKEAQRLEKERLEAIPVRENGHARAFTLIKDTDATKTINRLKRALQRVYRAMGLGSVIFKDTAVADQFVEDLYETGALKIEDEKDETNG